MMQAEALEVCQGDKILTHGEGPSIGWEEHPHQDAAVRGLQEDSAVLHTLAFADVTFRISTTLEACFDTLRSLYISYGWDGVDELLHSNGLHYERRGHRLVGKDPTLEEAMGDRLPLYRLLQAARTDIERLASGAIPPLTDLSRSAALARLEDARQQMRDEARRYFAISPRAVSRALEGQDAYAPASSSTEWQSLLDALKECQPLLQAVQRAKAAARKAFERKSAEFAKWGGGVTMFSDVAVPSPPQLIMTALESDPEIRRLDAEAHEASAALQEHLAGAGAEFPVLWRIYATENVSDEARLGQEILDTLRSAWQSNIALTDTINDAPHTVWKFPSVVYEAMALGAIPRLSIAWSAAEIRIGEEVGMRTASAIGLLTGLSLMGTAGLAAIAGTAAIAPPLVVAITIVDMLVNLIDAWQEYLDYQLHKQAFEASLDPSRSLAAEPSFLWAAFVVSMNILSILPGPTPKAPK
jgi:hypothetical protein